VEYHRLPCAYDCRRCVRMFGLLGDDGLELVADNYNTTKVYARSCAFLLS
jgi:hypothetical protein